MCGIVGYIGPKEAAPLLLDALEKLEYRGYDSAGLALNCNGRIQVEKARGRLKNLREITKDGSSMPGCAGIGHTRWATHGEPSDINSHPHLSHSGRVAVVHNGIVENFMQLRAFLIEHGYQFVSDTDTEIISQLVDYYYCGDPLAAVRNAVERLQGSFALGILFADFPSQLIAVRKDSPLIIGLGRGENFIASDIPAILKHTRDIYRLDEREMAVIRRDGVEVFNQYGDPVQKEAEHITWNADAAERGGYEHFMIKEIMEQPQVIQSTVHPRIHTGDIALELTKTTPEVLRKINRIYIVACGSAYYAGVLGKHLIERLARVPVITELASEFRYNEPVLGDDTLTIIVSQSGETLDTLFALRQAKESGSHVISIVNVVGSSIANESGDVLYTWAGPEIAVATTKAYSAQITMMHLVAMHIAKCRGLLKDSEKKAYLEQMEALPALLAGVLERQEQIQYLASLYFNAQNVFFIGRNTDFALALEGSLKLKEICYIHSEAYAAGELKHGPISLVEDGTLVVALCTHEPLREKMISNIREVKARGAVVLALAQEGAPLVDDAADHVVWLPKCGQYALPSLAIAPLQLFAYYMASLRGCDIDKPRNLAKSVTVE